MIFTTLLYNAALLLSLGFLYSLIARRLYENQTAGQIYKGLLFGCFAVGVMANPVQLVPGVVFDTRSVVVSVAGLFGGPIPAAISILMAAAFRVWEGGLGTLTGVSVILVSGLLGVAYHYWSRKNPKAKRALPLYGLGLAVHVAMLLCMFILPWPVALKSLRAITLPVLLIYPLVTMLLALLLAQGEINLRNLKALQESENRFRTSFDRASSGMTLTGTDGRLIRVNEQFCQMLGYTSKELVGKYFNDITHPDDLTVGEEFIKKTLAGEISSAQFEKRYLHKNGKPVWTRVSAALVKDTDGRPLNFITTIQDISESREAVRALRESEARYRQIVETADEGVWRVDANHYTTFANQRMADMLGYTSEEMLGRQPHEFMPESELGDHQARMRDRQRGEIGHYERRFLHKDGGEIWCMASVSPVLDGQGRFDGALGMFTDITDRKKAEAERREAILRQEEAVKAGNVGLWGWNLDTNQVSFSQEWKSQIGYQDHEIGDGFDEWKSRVHPDDLQATLREVEKSIATASKEHQTEFRFRHKDGSYRWILSQASVLTDESGRPIRMLGSHVDITEIKRAHEELRQSEENFRHLFDNMLNGFAYCHMLFEDGRPQDFIYLQVNEAFEQQTGLKGVEGKLVSEVIPGIRENDPGLLEIYGRVALTGQPERFETYLQTLDMWFSVAVYSPRKEYFVAIFDVITERKKAEFALRQSEERFRRALANTPDVLVIYGPDLKIRYINEATERLTGHPPSHYIGKTDDEIWPPEVCDKYLPTLKEAAETLTTRSIDVEATLTHGKESFLNIVCIPLADDKGNLLEILGITHDLTERIRTESEKEKLEGQLRQAQKMEAVGTLAGGIAHDFNNILSAILGYSELVMEQTPDDSPNRDHLQQVLIATERAQHLVKQILTFSRKAEVKPKPVDLNRRIEVVVELIGRTIPKMVEIQLHLAEDLKPVSGDSVQLEQVLLNLATNANDAMPDGGLLIIETENVYLDQEYCRTHFEAEPGEYVCVQVSDTGEGMTEDVRSQIFDPFFTTKEVGKGTGLGLATAYGIVRAHGGFIYCYSEPGHGTNFKIYLPIQKTYGSQKAIIAPQGKELPVGNETILIVDDEQPLRELGKLFLSGQGFSVLLADSGEQALEIYQKHGADVDLVIMDVSMPGMGGHKSIQELLKLDPNVKVLVASGYSKNGHLKETLAAGALGYIAKPYQRAKLLQVVREILDN